MYLLTIEAIQSHQLNATIKTSMQDEKRVKKNNIRIHFAFKFLAKIISNIQATNREYLWAQHTLRLFMLRFLFLLFSTHATHMSIICPIRCLIRCASHFCTHQFMSIVCVSYTLSNSLEQLKGEARAERCNRNKRIWISVSGNSSADKLIYARESVGNFRFFVCVPRVRLTSRGSLVKWISAHQPLDENNKVIKRYSWAALCALILVIFAVLMDFQYLMCARTA